MAPSLPLALLLWKWWMLVVLTKKTVRAIKRRLRKKRKSRLAPNSTAQPSVAVHRSTSAS